MEDPITNIEFYKEQYLHEHERSRSFDNVIQIPTTLLVIFIGGGFYFYTNYFTGAKIYFFLLTFKSWCFVASLLLFVVSIGITIIYLYRVYHGWTRRYEHLPFSKDLHNYELTLYKYSYKYSDKKAYSDKRNDAKSQTCSLFGDEIKKYYIKLADINQRINDRRSENYFWTRTFLFIDLVLLVIIAFLDLLK